MIRPKHLRHLLILAVAATPLVASAADSFATHLYVAPTGSDSADGQSPDRAFASLNRARDELRRLKTSGPLPTGGVAVEIAGGTYTLSESFALSAEDSGTAAAPIVYRAYQNQPVRLLGGRVIPRSALRPVSDPAQRSRLDPLARDQVLAVSIAELGLKHAGPFPTVFSDSGGLLELFWDGHRMPLSRWPNEGWTTMKRVVVNGDEKTPGVFEYRDDRPARWLKNPDIWLKGQWRVGWEDPAIRVASIDPEKGQISFAAGIFKGIGSKYKRPEGSGQEPWCALNLPEEIDRPGEWAVDFTTRTLFVWPMAAQGELLVSQVSEPLIAVNGAGWLQFVGLTLEGSLGDGFGLKDVRSVLVAGCTVRNLAHNAVVLDGTDSTIQSCDFYDLGGGGVVVYGGVAKTLTPSNNQIINNHIHHYGVLKAMYSAAVNVGFGEEANGVAHRDAVGMLVAHNLIHNAPRDAILVSGQDHVFEFNDISRCGFETADTGSFYACLDWTVRGVMIRHNFMHDTVGGVNPDDGTSGFTVTGNIMVGPRTGIWIASGPDHTVENNVFVKEEGPVFAIDDRGLTRGYTSAATAPRLYKGVAAINPTSPPWSVRFPTVATMLENHPELPLRNHFERNLIVIQKGEPIALKLSKATQENPAILTTKDNWVTAADPGFVNAAEGNYGLKPDAAVFKNIPGFKPIPFDKIGLQLDAYRRSLPDALVSRPVPPAEGAAPQPDQHNNFGT